MWITLSSADVQQKLAADEYDAVTSASLPDGVTAAEIITDELSRTLAQVRGFVSANKSNALGDGETIPDELKDAALVIVRYKVFTRLPGMKALLDELRVKEYEEATRLLRDVSAGRFAIVPPTTPAADDEQAAPSTIETVSAPTRRNKRENLEGLY